VFNLAIVQRKLGKKHVKDNLSQRTDRKEESFIHTVKWPGETISIVAKWYTGNVNHWKQIAKINPGLDPKKIVIGNKISIPKSLIIRSQRVFQLGGFQPLRRPSRIAPTGTLRLTIGSYYTIILVLYAFF